MNKTEHELNGELKVEGLPVDNVDNALLQGLSEMGFISALAVEKLFV